MTRLAIDEELYQQAIEAASAQGKTVEQFVGEALHKALAELEPKLEIRNGLPVMVVSPQAPRIDPAMVRKFLEEEGP